MAESDILTKFRDQGRPLYILVRMGSIRDKGPAGDTKDVAGHHRSPTKRNPRKGRHRGWIVRQLGWQLTKEASSWRARHPLLWLGAVLIPRLVCV